MTVFSWLWLFLFGGSFLVLEAVAIVKGDAPGKPRTLTANVRALITGSGRWHYLARAAVMVLLAWLPIHFGLVG